MIAVDVAAALTALIHIKVFRLESLTWTRPSTRKLFGTTPEQAEQSKLLAFNQGFYNLFLSIAILTGWVLMGLQREIEGRTLVDYGMASACGAGLVLWLSARKLWRPALIQAGPPIVYAILRLL